jgi:hypothetical protein
LHQRSRALRRLHVAAAALLACAVFATVFGSTASATVTVSQFTLQPTNLQAGGSPNFSLVSKLQSSSGDTARNVVLSLAPGIAIYPVGQPTCTPTQLNNAACPANSTIGQGTTTATALGLLTLSINTKLYLMTPPDSKSINSIGAVATLLVSIELPITNSIRQTPTTGDDMHITNAPNKLLNLVPVQLDGQNWTVNGVVNGKPFTRVPTTCNRVTSNISVTSYNSTQVATGSNSFTPTGCSHLGFSASATASASLDANGNVTATASLLAHATDSATASAVLTVPASLEPNVDAVTAANQPGCSQSTLSGCPVVGSVTGLTPLWGTPLTGKIYMVGHSGLLPTVTIVTDPPVTLIFNAGFALISGNRIQITLTGLPDVPVTSLALTLFGGPGGLLVPAPTLCAAPGTVNGQMTAQDGASIAVTTPVVVSGCNGAPGQTPVPVPVSNGIGTTGSAPGAGGFGVTGFQLSPSTAQASTIAAPTHPDLTANSTFQYGDGTDSVKDATLTLPPGLLANPTQVPATCSPDQLNGDACPAGSQVGFGTVTANVSGAQGEVSGSQTVDTSIFLMPAQSNSEYARLGIIGSLAGRPLITLEGVATLSPTGQAVLTINDIPRESTIFDVTVDAQITGLSLTIHGAVAGNPFTVGPGECVPSPSNVTVDTYEQPAQVSAASTYAPTGCPPIPDPLPPATGTGSAPDGSTATFTLLPDDTDVGANANLTTIGSFTYPDSSSAVGGPANCAQILAAPNAQCDWLKQVTVLLAPGLEALPAAPTQLCTPSELSSDSCPPQSEIGAGTVSTYTYDTTHDGNWGEDNNLPTVLYEMPATSPSEIREVGLIVYQSGKAVVSVIGSAGLSTAGQVQLTFRNLPSQAALGTLGVEEWAQVYKMSITVFNIVDGNIFTVNPSGCQPATSMLLANTSESPTAAASASSTFLPTGC